MSSAVAGDMVIFSAGEFWEGRFSQYYSSIVATTSGTCSISNRLLVALID